MTAEYKKEKLIRELIAGICELTYMDSFSVEHKMSVTLSPNHLDGDVESIDSPVMIRMWDMIEESWQDILITSIIDFERLTGFGIKDERNLVDFENIPFI